MRDGCVDSWSFDAIHFDGVFGSEYGAFAWGLGNFYNEGGMSRATHGNENVFKVSGSSVQSTPFVQPSAPFLIGFPYVKVSLLSQTCLFT